MKLEIVAHTMEYHGEHMQSSLQLRNYSACNYDEYKKIYEECFHDMRSAYQLYPVDCCYSEEGLEHKKDNIYILEVGGELIGSVAIYGNEIDDLIVRKSCQRMGYGEALLRFAVSQMQNNDISPITLHVAEWNQGAIRMYLKNGFTVVRTEKV